MRLLHRCGLLYPLEIIIISTRDYHIHLRLMDTTGLIDPLDIIISLKLLYPLEIIISAWDYYIAKIIISADVGRCTLDYYMGWDYYIHLRLMDTTGLIDPLDIIIISAWDYYIRSTLLYLEIYRRGGCW